MSVESKIKEAVELLLRNELVGMPTETVYGLAGRISSSQALEKIFAMKKRPLFDPLIVHVADTDSAKRLSSGWNQTCEVLAAEFWPGPLTIVVKKNKEAVHDLITAGLDSVGIRCPEHQIARKLISAVGEPLAAPSANLFSKTSPSTASHVRESFPELFVLDGGDAAVGIESTVIRVSEEGEVSILRKGIVTPSAIEKVLSANGLPSALTYGEGKSASPGQEKEHYQMNSPLYLVHSDDIVPESLSEAKELVFSSREPLIVARELYASMHRMSAEAKGSPVIFYVKDYMKGELWDAILDRLTRAAAKTVI